MSGAPTWAADFPVRAQNALRNNDVVNLEDFAKMTERDARRMRGIGPKTARMILLKLRERGLSFAPDASAWAEDVERECPNCRRPLFISLRFRVGADRMRP